MTVDISDWRDLLLHPVEALSAEGIQARAEEAGISADKVEIFGWLLEIAAQAAEASDGLDLGAQPIILRGGTSAQLRVSEGRERVSADVDVLLRGSLRDAERLIAAINERLSPCAPYLQFVEVERTEKPIGEFRAWRAFVPRQFGGARPGQQDDPGRAILFEVHAIGHEDGPPAAPLAGIAFGMALTADVPVSGLTAGALIGDKLDCLAASLPIGIDEPKYDKHARHIYDITQLRESNQPLTAPMLDDAVLAVRFFTRRDAQVRPVTEHGPVETMFAAEEFLTSWGWPQPPAPRDARFDKANSFEQYVAKQHRTRALGWSLRALQAALLARAVRDTVNKGSTSAMSTLRGRQARVTEIAKLSRDELTPLVDSLSQILLPDGTAAARKAATRQLLPKTPVLAQIQRLAFLAVLLIDPPE